MKHNLLAVLAMIAILCAGCSTRKADELEMRKSLNNFIFSVDELHADGLEICALFPGVTNYREYVKNLLINYIDALKSGQVEFDETGVVLSRFLGLATHRYAIKEMKIDREAGEAELMVSVHYAYANNIRSAFPEQGTTYYIPTEPFGHVSKLVIGEDNPIPREDLDYVEIKVSMVASEHEGFWLITNMKVDEDSIRYKTSYESFSEEL